MEFTDAQQALLDVVPDTSALIDPTGTILSVNQAWMEFCAANGGDETSYYIGQNYLDICDRATGDGQALSNAVRDGLYGVLAADDIFRCEYPCHSATDQRWFEIIAKPFNISGERCAIIMHRNITTRKLQQIEVTRAQVSANQLAALVATATDAIISFDLEGRILRNL